MLVVNLDVTSLCWAFLSSKCSSCSGAFSSLVNVLRRRILVAHITDRTALALAGKINLWLKCRECEEEHEEHNSFNRAIQVAIPGIVIGAGALSILTGVEGALEIVGLAATTSFVAYELLWVQSSFLVLHRKRLWKDLEKVTDHEKLTNFLKSRNIVKDI
eukprot:Gb_03689 [translate_table: standard]